MSAVLTMATKDLRLLWRDPGGLFWVFGFPLIMAVLFGSIYSGMSSGPAGALEVALVDEDASPQSQAFTARLGESAALRVKPYADVAAAREAVRRGKVPAYVVLRAGYGRMAGAFWEKNDKLEAGIDPARRAEGGYLQGLLTQTTFGLLQDEFADPQRMRQRLGDVRTDIQDDTTLDYTQRQVLLGFFSALDLFLGSVDPQVYDAAPAFEPVAIQEVETAPRGESPHSSFEVSFPSAIIWGLLGCAATFALGLVRERTAGTLLRLQTAPVSRGALVAGKGLACFATCVCVVLVLLLVGKLGFKVRLEQPGQLIAATVCSALCFTGLSMLLSVIGRTEQAVAGAGWGILILLAMFGGGMVPLLFMPAWMQKISDFSPVKWCVLGLEGAIWRRFSWLEMAQPCLVLTAVGAAGLLAGSLLLRRWVRN